MGYDLYLYSPNAGRETPPFGLPVVPGAAACVRLSCGRRPPVAASPDLARTVGSQACHRPAALEPAYGGAPADLLATVKLKE